MKGHPGHKVLINQFGSERRMAMALGVERLDQIAERIKGLMNVKAPSGGFFDKLKMLPQLAELGNVFPEDGDGEGCAVQGSDSARELRSECVSDFEVLAAMMAGGSSHCLACTRAIRATASATSACIGCRCTTGRRRGCTGSGRRWRRSTIANALRAQAAVGRADWRSACGERGGDGGVGRRRGGDSRWADRRHCRRWRWAI